MLFFFFYYYITDCTECQIFSSNTLSVEVNEGLLGFYGKYCILVERNIIIFDGDPFRMYVIALHNCPESIIAITICMYTRTHARTLTHVHVKWSEKKIKDIYKALCRNE